MPAESSPAALDTPRGYHIVPSQMQDPERRSTPAAIERQIELERVSTLYALAPTTLVGGLAYAFLMVPMLYPHCDLAVIVAWLVTKVGVAAFRLVDGRLFRRDERRLARLSHWKHRFFFAVIVDSFC